MNISIYYARLYSDNLLSNWCELALRKMGHQGVFCHVGDSGMCDTNQRDIGSAPLIQLPVLINTPNGRAPPLVTGTFGSADFLHSLMGEATEYV